MDPDRYQMRDLKRRMSKLEDQIGYLKTDWKRTAVALSMLTKVVAELAQRADLEDWKAKQPKP